MKILYSPASPYSAKVRMAALHAGMEFESVIVETNKDPVELIAANPLGKIPTMIADDGRGVYDSRAIMHYIDREGTKRIYPRKGEKRTDAEVLEALADGICDCLLAIVYEKRMRPEEKVHQDWIDRQWAKAERGMDHLEANMPRLGKTLNGGHFALAAMTSYLALRFPGQWERGRPKLKAFSRKFSLNFPELDDLRPKG